MRSVLLALVLAGCTGVPDDLALGEPLVVRSATFVEGPLPSSQTAAPTVTLVETANSTVVLGEATKAFDGRTSTDAVAIGVALTGDGTGYWVLPVGAPDPTADYQPTWSIDTSIGWDLQLGSAAIEFIALDADGAAGAANAQPICVRPDLPDDDSTCDPSATPPDTVISLSWDADVDLDLFVITPDGKVVGHDHPSTVSHQPITAADLAAPHVGLLDRDSNAGCVIDGIDREDLVWQTSPERGTYLVYADLASACGRGAVRFRATVYRSDGTRLVAAESQDGELLPEDADGGVGPGLFLLQLAF